MKNDFLKEIEYLGLIARIKRLNDAVLYSIRDLYKTENVDIEPNWHLVFLILRKHKTRTNTEIAEAFGFSQPAVCKIIHKMKEKGYIDTVRDTNDDRKRGLRLSQKAINELPRFEKIWNAGQQSIKELLREHEELPGLLEKIEQQIEEKSFKQRVLDHLRND